MSLLGRRGMIWRLPSGNGSGTRGSAGGDLRVISGLALNDLASFRLGCLQGPPHFICVSMASMGCLGQSEHVYMGRAAPHVLREVQAAILTFQKWSPPISSHSSR